MENNKINIAEILKDCPTGTKLYSPIFGDVYLDKIRPHLVIVVTTDKEQGDIKEEFLYDGRYGMNGECMLFPSKNKTTWEGFQRPFQDGDIIFTCAVFNGICSDYLYTGLYYTWISIFHKMRKDQVITYVDMENSGKYFPFWTCKGELCRKNDIISQRLATEEEKERLFKYIKDNGYKWNAETKTLEKLVEPKFKVGDKIRSEHFLEERTIKTCEEDGYWTTVDSWIKISDQDEWELVPDKIVPKFKVGDRIKHRLTGEIYMIMFVLPHGGGTYEVAVTNEIGKSISIKEQDNYELMSDKFDISTLVPFDKVLVRHNTNEKWDIDFFSCIDNGKMFRTITGTYVQCIPYEGNEHLLDTDKDCNNYYKSWED